NEVFSGIVGQGAWLNGRPMSTSGVRRTRDDVLCTDFPVSTDFSAGALGAFVDGVRAFKKIRLLGTAAQSLAYVASGRTDVYAERDIKIWDVAAGVAVLRAAGGKAIVKAGRQPMTRIVVGSNGRLPPAALASLSATPEETA
ncbi:MAG: hypothetical protein FJX78_10775, partial [Armatimonadetes bacterium]|nr:hypothetical protein [Armatimonadota bacterium]